MHTPSKVLALAVKLIRMNLEEPGLFNLHLERFLAAVEAGRWAGWSR